MGRRDWTAMQCKNPGCGLPFMVRGGQTGPQIETETINCPHCGHVCGSARIADAFVTRAMTPEELAEYEPEES